MMTEKEIMDLLQKEKNERDLIARTALFSSGVLDKLPKTWIKQRRELMESGKIPFDLYAY